MRVISYLRGFSGVIIITLMLCCYIAKAWNLSTTREVEQVEVKVPCFFIFGDSLVDNGNNNDIPTFVRSNFLPYGIDFPQGPTGRFTNGRTFVDFLAEFLGFPDFIPPFSEARYIEVLQGANFASGAAGIRDETGNYLGVNVPMNEQIRNFGIVVELLREYFRGDENSLQNYLSKCIIYSGLGNNDYLNNYLLPLQYPESSQFTQEEFAAILLEEYQLQLKELYNLGVRKMILPNIAQVGCIPIKRLRNGTREGRCNEDQNNVIQPFNSGLRNLVDTLNNNGELPGAKFVYLDYYEACKEIDSNRKSYGLEVVDKGCCGEGMNNVNGGHISCLPFQTPCDDRKKFFFWDAFHPSEVVHMILANKAYTSDSNSYAYPINIKQLAML